MVFQFKVEFVRDGTQLRCLGEPLVCRDVVLQAGGTITDGCQTKQVLPGVYTLSELLALLS